MLGEIDLWKGFLLSFFWTCSLSPASPPPPCSNQAQWTWGTQCQCPTIPSVAVHISGLISTPSFHPWPPALSLVFDTALPSTGSHFCCLGFLPHDTRDPVIFLVAYHRVSPWDVSDYKRVQNLASGTWFTILTLPLTNHIHMDGLSSFCGFHTLICNVRFNAV